MQSEACVRVRRKESELFGVDGMFVNAIRSFYAE